MLDWRSLRPWATLLVAFAPSIAFAQLCQSPTDTFWKNDTIPQIPTGQTPVAIIQGLCENEALGSVFTLPGGMGPQKLNKVAVGFGDSFAIGGFNAVANVEIYDGITWAGNTAVLGPKVFDLANDAAANLQVFSHGINELDISPFNVVVGNHASKSFVVSFRSLINPNGNCTTGYPANYFTDGTGQFQCTTIPQKNVIDIIGQGWKDPATATVGGFPICPIFYNGNWVIRACSENAGPFLCQTDKGFAGPGLADAKLSICGPPLSAGNFASFKLEKVTPNTPVYIFVSTVFNPTFLPDTFAVLCPFPPQLSVILPSDANGEINLPNAVPGTSVVIKLYIQCVAPDASQINGYEHSNCLEAQFG